MTPGLSSVWYQTLLWQATYCSCIFILLTDTTCLLVYQASLSSSCCVLTWPTISGRSISIPRPHHPRHTGESPKKANQFMVSKEYSLRSMDIIDCGTLPKAASHPSGNEDWFSLGLWRFGWEIFLRISHFLLSQIVQPTFGRKLSIVWEKITRCPILNMIWTYIK